MSLFGNIFKKKEEPLRSYADFWNWFSKNAEKFYRVVKNHNDIEHGFFDKLSPKLDELMDGFWYLTGMDNDDTAELIITADGAIKNFVFVEELIEAAPPIKNWKFTALKPALTNSNISMSGYEFGKDTLHFYQNENPGYPDEIDITITHDQLTEENRKDIVTGVYIFLDNYLGELNFATMVDALDIIEKNDAEKELIPIEKLKDYLAWRQKEFVEKYDGVRHHTGEDEHSIMETKLENGRFLIGTINTGLLQWDQKASHPWILTVTIPYNGEENNGMPDEITYKALNEIFDLILNELKDVDGYLNIGRETGNGEMEIYYACKDFRKPSKTIYRIQQERQGQYNISYKFYKDKYWRSFDRLNPLSPENIVANM